MEPDSGERLRNVLDIPAKERRAWWGQGASLHRPLVSVASEHVTSSQGCTMSEDLQQRQQSLMRDRLAWLSLACFVLFLSSTMRILLSASRPPAPEAILTLLIVGCCMWIAAKLPSRFGWAWTAAACVGSAGAALLLRTAIQAILATP
jgi:hypothetical protein